MATPKAQCLSWLIEAKSDIQTRRNSTAKYGIQAPVHQSIFDWHKQFAETGDGGT